MKKIVYKFGGSFFEAKVMLSLVKFFLKIINSGSVILFVVSAMKGITRLLRVVVATKTSELEEDLKEEILSMTFTKFYEKHMKLISQLFSEDEKYLEEVKLSFKKLFSDLKDFVGGFERGNDEDEFYASVLKYGELASSLIFNFFLKFIGISSFLFDARKYVITTNDHREAKILEIRPSFRKLFSFDYQAFVTQGFIGKNEKGEDTVCGFDASDVSAAKFAIECKVIGTFWKDEKLFKEDPKLNPKAVPVNEMLNSEYQKLHSHPIRPDAVQSLVDNGLEARMKCFLFPDEYEARIYV